MQRCSNRARQWQFKSLTWVMMIVGVTETGAERLFDWGWPDVLMQLIFASAIGSQTANFLPMGTAGLRSAFDPKRTLAFVEQGPCCKRCCCRANQLSQNKHGHICRRDPRERVG
jgi:hypothetical protein